MIIFTKIREIFLSNPCVHSLKKAMVRAYLFSFLKIGKDFFSKYGKSLSIALSTSLTLASLLLFTACAGADGGEEENALSSLTLEIGGTEYAVNFDDERNAEIPASVSGIASIGTAVVSNLKLKEGATAKDSSDKTITDGSSVPMSASGDNRKVEINVTDKDDNTRIYTITITITLDEITSITLKGHSDDVYSVAYSPDGTKIASGSSDDTIKIWDATVTGDSSTPIATLSGRVGRVNSVAFSPDGSRLVSGSYDNIVKIWDATVTGDVTASIATLSEHTLSVNSVAFSPDGSKIASGSYDNSVKIWDATVTGDVTASSVTLSRHTLRVNSVAFSPDGSKLASGGDDKSINIWDASKLDGNTPTASLIATLSGHSSSGVLNSVAFSPDGLKIAGGSTASKIKIWDATVKDNTSTPIATLSEHSHWVRSVAFSPDASRLASGSADKTIIIWDVAKSTPTPIATLSGHDDTVNSVAFSPDGTKLASASFDDTVKIWW